ncbi:enterobactin transporter EntS [Vibrio mangrovi]|uniref:Multidrug efflux pump Tap n=1 Tax=Vibrio mangrovi TaxID=474394 RepID=A0A1Y6IZ10_9VIBR|nr:enterobactin transporter EntS [Vibrio mangrovi]MDW6003041.1 enterobactin transporter EntS [Vibrio mangrovi]SMS01283.1 Enterobactin exporter EntS [Vibrio mangrovi]
MSTRKPSFLVDTSLLTENPAYRHVFIARFISILALGMLMVALPVQIEHMTHSPFYIGLSVTLAGSGMLAGLLLGGVLADRYARKPLILFARTTCGIGFLLLAWNSTLEQPSLLIIYLLSVWDGFFGAIGVTALLAATPSIVGRDKLMQAGALTMLTVRFGSILSPVIAGLIIARWDVTGNYLLAASGTGITLLPLLRLPRLEASAVPQDQARKAHPWNEMSKGIKFVLHQPLIRSITLIGALVTMMNAVRILYPALAQHWQLSESQLGLMYAALPLGSALGALTCGRLIHVSRPGQLLLLSAVITFAAIAVFSLMSNVWLALLTLVVAGYCSGLNALVQYPLLQACTPDHLLGRMNSLWTAQNVLADALGAVALGSLGSSLSPEQGASGFGIIICIIGLFMWLNFSHIRHYQTTSPVHPPT